jgi:hypothetical protein
MVFPCSPRKTFSVIRPLLILTVLVGQIVGGRSCCCFSSEATRWIGDSICRVSDFGTNALGTNAPKKSAIEKSSNATRTRSDAVQNPTWESATRRCPKCVSRQINLESEKVGRSEPVRGRPAFGRVSSCQCQSHSVSAMVHPIESPLEVGSQVLIPHLLKPDLGTTSVRRHHRVSPTDVSMRISWQARACIWRI